MLAAGATISMIYGLDFRAAGGPKIQYSTSLAVIALKQIKLSQNLFLPPFFFLFFICLKIRGTYS
jgi:hypothetical protein